MRQPSPAQAPTPDNATAAGLLTGLPKGSLHIIGSPRPRHGNVAMLYLGEAVIRSAATLGPGGAVALPAGAVSGLVGLSRQRDGMVDEYLRRQGIDGTPQRLLGSGGIELIYAALADARGEYPRRRGAADILAQGLSSRCLLSIETLERYCAMVGWAAADTALGAGAWAGLYLAGPLAERLLHFFPQSPLRRMFDSRHQPFADLSAVPLCALRLPQSD